MNLDELRPILHGYRKQLEAAWSPATAHQDYEGKQGDPTGQCGVTSAWLQRRLRDDHGIAASFWIGRLFAVRAHETLADHCWLELDTTEVDVIIDLTADQLPAMKDRPVVCAAYDDLFRDAIDYSPQRGVTSEALLADPVQARLSILTEALS